MVREQEAAAGGGGRWGSCGPLKEHTFDSLSFSLSLSITLVDQETWLLSVNLKHSCISETLIRNTHIDTYVSTILK